MPSLDVAAFIFCSGLIGLCGVAMIIVRVWTFAKGLIS